MEIHFLTNPVSFATTQLLKPSLFSHIPNFSNGDEICSENFMPQEANIMSIAVGCQPSFCEL